MSEPSVAARDDGAVELAGDMTFQTVPGLAAQAEPWLKGGRPTVSVDLAKVARVDTAGIALMLEWLERTRAERRELAFVNLPERARHLIGVSGLNEAFGL